jgi:hypothetical protein
MGVMPEHSANGKRIAAGRLDLATFTVVSAWGRKAP